MKKFQAKLVSENPENITKLLFKLVNDFTYKINELKEKFPNWDEFSDTRIFLFISLREVTNNAILTSIFIKDYLCKNEWWYNNISFDTKDINDKYISDRKYSFLVDFSTNYISDII